MKGGLPPLVRDLACRSESSYLCRPTVRGDYGPRMAIFRPVQWHLANILRIFAQRQPLSEAAQPSSPLKLRLPAE